MFVEMKRNIKWEGSEDEDEDEDREEEALL
jgi:hypothetical protein